MISVTIVFKLLILFQRVEQLANVESARLHPSTYKPYTLKALLQEPAIRCYRYADILKVNLACFFPQHFFISCCSVGYGIAFLLQGVVVQFSHSMVLLYYIIIAVYCSVLLLLRRVWYCFCHAEYCIVLLYYCRVLQYIFILICKSSMVITVIKYNPTIKGTNLLATRPILLIPPKITREAIIASRIPIYHL